MNVTRDVVRDLLPLYLAGEASPDTRALVEAYLRQEPEMAREVEALRGEDAPPSPAPALPPGPERVALRRARRLLTLRSTTMAMAIFFTLMPFSCAGDGAGLTWLMIRDAPGAAAASLALGVAGWIAHALVRRRLRVPGL